MPAFNPFLPSWEYIPDGEPYVFGDRVYVYGSHDYFNGYVFCLGDYMGWSAPADDLSAWRCEGVIYPKDADPLNREGRMCLYAPDVTQGPDGRYYLYYVLDKVCVVSVAVCDTPGGRYAFYGHVRYPDGTLLGEAPGDEPQFDPGVLTLGEDVYLYTGFCQPDDKTRHGAMCTRLQSDMLTVAERPRFIVPGEAHAGGASFAGHAYFEAASIRKAGDTFYFIYSSSAMHELCYATSRYPDRGFTYGGVLVSNCDLHMPPDPALPKAYGGNNHGSLVCVKGQWYVFYHRHTNGTWFSRQACAEPVTLLPDGSIPQAELTSCGLNGGPLPGQGEYPAYIACHLYTKERHLMSGVPGAPRFTQDGRDGDRENGYIAGIAEGTVIGFRYFDFHGATRVSVFTRGYAHGAFHISTSPGGETLAVIQVDSSNVWQEYGARVPLPEGKSALYLTYVGKGTAMLRAVAFD